MSTGRQAGRAEERAQSGQRGRRGRVGNNRAFEEGLGQVIERLDSRLVRRAKLAIKQGEIGPIRVQEGHLSASVSRKGPDKRSMEVSLPLVASWESLERSVATWFVQRPDWLAALLAGEWEEDFLRFLEGNGLTLSKSVEEMEPWLAQARCACDDWESPCRHVAALIIQMATEIEESPRTLFRFVGLSLDKILDETKHLVFDQEGPFPAGDGLLEDERTPAGMEDRWMSLWSAVNPQIREGAGVGKPKASAVVPILNQQRLTELCDRYLRST